MYLSALSLALTRPSGLSLSQLTAAIFTQYSASPSVWYDPSDLVWNWRRNLLTYTEQFDNAAWAKVAATVTANAATAPDGTLTADKLVEDATNNAHAVNSASFTFLAATSYTASVCVKAAERTWTLLQFATPPFGVTTRAWFNLATGVVGTTANCIASMVSLGDGWYRCSITATTTAGGAGVITLPYATTGNGVVTYTGDGTSGVFIWGAQLDLGTAATPYQRITDGVQDYFTYGSALPTLYQDSAGTTPVTAVGQPVGLMLDKSRGLVLGSELVTNGDFSNGLTGWTLAGGAQSVVSGSLRLLNDTATFAYNQQVVSGLVVGRAYVVSCTYTSPSSTGVVPSLRISGVGVATGIANTSGTLRLQFVAAGTSATVQAFNNQNTLNGECFYDNISVRELPGLHASQSTPLNRPVLSSRYNQVLNSGFAGAVAGTPGTAPTSWTYVLSGGTTDSVSVSDGAGGFVWSASTSANRHFLTQTTPSLPVSSVHAFTVTLVATVGSMPVQQLVALVNAPAGATQVYLRNGAVVAATDVPVAGDVIGVRVTVSTTAGTVALRFGVGCQSNVTASASFAKASFVAQNENTLPYQRVTTATDYDADFTKFPPFLSVDGTDDGMVTPSWDLTSTDKVTVVAGVRKLSDAATAVLLELSATTNSNNGSFNIAAPSGIYEYGFTNGGSLRKDALLDSTTYAAPITNVVTTIGSISADTTTLRLNGAQVAASAGELGTGTYGNYPLYLFRRGGTTLPFNGRFYGLTIIGAQLSTSDITVLERYQAQKTGITV